MTAFGRFLVGRFRYVRPGMLISRGKTESTVVSAEFDLFEAADDGCALRAILHSLHDGDDVVVGIAHHSNLGVNGTQE